MGTARGFLLSPEVEPDTIKLNNWSYAITSCKARKELAFFLCKLGACPPECLTQVCLARRSVSRRRASPAEVSHAGGAFA
jgi:hypothetical protein